MQIEPQGDSYKALLATLRDSRWYQQATGRILLELAFHLVTMVGGIALFLAVDNVAVKALALILSTAGGLGVATNTHTSSHNATSKYGRFNRALTYFGYTFCFGVPAHFWWHKHVVVHHPNPNLIGVDDDADLAPWFAITEEDVRRSRGLKRLYYRVQWVLVPLALSVNLFNIQQAGLRFMFRRLTSKQARASEHRLDLAVVLLHFAVWLVAPMFIYGVGNALVFYAMRGALMGYAMFIAFAPAHFPAEAVFAGADERKTDFVLRQTATTVNFRTGFFGRLYCSGVEYQIEHHLFPRISHIYYPEISPLVQEFCRDNGYPYQTLGWMEGIWKSLVLFARPKPIVETLASELATDGAETETLAAAG